MGTYGPREARLRDGRAVVVRNLQPEDADAFVVFHRVISAETQFTMQRPEDPATVEKSRERFRRVRDEGEGVMFGVFAGEELAGVGGLHPEWSGHPWVRHVMGFGMMVRSSYWGSGLAKILMDAMLDHAALHGVRRIEGRVRANNPRGLAFYARMGFAVEGTHRCAAIIDGIEIDELTIAGVT